MLDFGEMCNALEKFDLGVRYRRRASAIKEIVNKEFWQGNYYYDWIGIVKHDIFATDGNVLAILFDIADNGQSNMIENKIKQHRMNKVPLQVNYPKYPFWRIPPGFFPLETYNYHNGSSWLWLGCLNAMALHKTGRKKEAKQELKAIASAINAHGSVHEVFLDGKPINSLLLKSEPFFAWSSGLFVKAVKEISGKGIKT